MIEKDFVPILVDTDAAMRLAYEAIQDAGLEDRLTLGLNVAPARVHLLEAERQPLQRLGGLRIVCDADAGGGGAGVDLGLGRAGAEHDDTDIITADSRLALRADRLEGRDRRLAFDLPDVHGQADRLHLGDGADGQPRPGRPDVLLLVRLTTNGLDPDLDEIQI